MPSKWMHSEWVTHILWAGAVAVFICAEAVVIVACLGLPQGRPSLGIGEALMNVFLTSIPGVVAIGGYRVIRRLRSRFDAERQDVTFIWLSRQFLVGAIFAYAAIVSIVISLGEVLHVK